jgi:hypothetical protein
MHDSILLRIDDFAKAAKRNASAFTASSNHL